MSRTTYSDLDREVVILVSVWDLIGSMVNYAHFEKGHGTDDVRLIFRNHEASKLFLILLADFLSLPRAGTLGLTRPAGTGSLASTYLGLLDAVAANPQLGSDATMLATPLRTFASWLDSRAVVDGVWLPSIGRDGPIQVQRITFLVICGTVSKHSLTRLDNIVKKIQKVLLENGTEIDEGQAYLALPEFQEWFYNDIFHYHATSIACFLNNIRWGIFEYLVPELRRSYRLAGQSSGLNTYEYEVPREISDPLIRAMYWDLMNNMRSEPYFPRFTVDPTLRSCY